MEVWGGEKGRKVYGARKIWLELNSRGIPVARCTVERLMRELGIRGASPGRKRPPTTLPGDPADRPSDLLERCFDAAAPNRRWVADITYVQTFSGWVYTAFVMDLFARRVLGWQVADHLRSDLALDALEMAIWATAGRGSRRPGPSFRPWRPVHVYPLRGAAGRGKGSPVGGQ